MAAIQTAISKLFEEDLDGGVVDSLPVVDSFAEEWANMQTSQRDGIGRGWQVINTFSESLSGAVRFVAAGGAELATNQLTHSTVPGNPREYPGLDESALTAYIQKTIPLVEALGNTFVPQHFMHQDVQPAAIWSSVEDILRGTAKTIALSDVFCTYAIDAYKSICQIPSSLDTNTGSVAIFSPVGGQPGSIQNGQNVDLLDSSGLKLNSVLCRVDGVRYVPDATDDTVGYGEVTIKTVDGSVGWNTASLPSGYVVPADPTVAVGTAWPAHGIAGPESWLINTGTAFGINVGTYEQFKSVVLENANQALDESLLNKLFGRFFKAYGMVNMPDCIVTSMGVTNAYVETYPGLGSLQVFRTHGQTLQPNAGYDLGTTPYVYQGMKVKWKISSNMPSTTQFANQSTSFGGRLWAMKTREQNIRRVTPVPLPGAKANRKYGREVQFAYANRGPDGIFWPYTSASGRLTEWMQAPFNRWVAVYPKFMQGIRVTGLKESL